MAERFASGEYDRCIISRLRERGAPILSMCPPPKYATSLGKNANCQTLVSLMLARGAVPMAAPLRLFLPESWTSEPTRMLRARVPHEQQAWRSKTAIAIARCPHCRKRINHHVLPN